MSEYTTKDFKWDYCPQCHVPMIRCPECNNNMCNGATGKNGTCQTCKEAYAYQQANRHKAPLWMRIKSKWHYSELRYLIKFYLGL